MYKVAEFSKEVDNDKLGGIWLAIMTTGVNDLYLLLDDTVDYEDIGKINFIKKLELNFVKYRLLGDNEFYIDLDDCVGCNCNLPICRFIGNKSKHSFGLFFEIKKNLITDIYHCNFYGKIDFYNPF